jgi:hypothetical protein
MPQSISGPTFLWLYGGLFGCALVVMLLIQRIVTSGRKRSGSPSEQLTAQEAAFLRGGHSRAHWTAVLEGGGGEAKRVPTFALVARLQERGYLATDAQASFLRWIGAMVFSSVLAAGVARYVVGVQRHKPVGWLVLLMVGVALTVLVYASKKMWITSSARAALRDLEAAARAGRADPALAFAVLGEGALASHSSLRLELLAAGYVLGHDGGSSSGSGCSGGAGCGGGGGGGCGGGCGGCGS